MRMVKIMHTFYGSNHDITWMLMPVWMWTGIEAHVAVIIASLPALNHFFRRIIIQPNLSDKFTSASHHLGKRLHKSSGYNKTSNSTFGDHNDSNDDRIMYATQDVQLETLPGDRDHEKQTCNVVSDDEEIGWAH
jgi:hypothetical protein